MSIIREIELPTESPSTDLTRRLWSLFLPFTHTHTPTESICFSFCSEGCKNDFHISILHFVRKDSCYFIYVRIRYFILYALSRFLLPFALKNYFAKGVSIHNSRVSSVLGFKRRLQIERRSHYVFLPLQPLAAPEPGCVCNWCKWARLGGCASHGVACYRRELLHIWLHLFFYSFEKLKDLFLSSFRLRFFYFCQLFFYFPQLMCSDWAASVCQFVKVPDGA